MLVTPRPLLLAAGLVAVMMLLAVGAPPAAAQFGDRIDLGGSYTFFAGLRLHGDADFLAAYNRAELLLTANYDRGRVVLRPRFDYDALSEELDADLREAYADVYFSRVDVRLGRQVLVWGETDGTFVTDLLAPLDLTEFFAQPFDDLRLGVTALSATGYAGDWEATAVLIPRRPTTRLPEAGSLWYPVPDALLGLPVEVTEPAPEDSTLGAAESALRVTWRGLPRTDLALLWINGFNRLPAFRKGLDVTLDPQELDVEARFAVTPAYERRQVLGATFETLALAPFVLRGEAALQLDALLDQPIEVPTTIEGVLGPDFQAAVVRGFLVERPVLDVALSAERTFGQQLVRLQGTGTVVFRHDDEVSQDAFEPAVTAFWTGQFRRQTLTPQALLYYNLGEDYWLNPALTYAVQDALNVTLGLHLFGGPQQEAGLAGLLREPAFSFATFDRNDFAYLRVAYAF